MRFGGPERSARLKLATSDGGRVDVDGRLTDAGADVRAQATALTLGLLDEDLAGRTDATLTLQGRGGRLDGTLAVRYGEKYLPVQQCAPAEKKAAAPTAQPTGKRRQAARGSNWNQNFDLKKAPKVWQAAQESGRRKSAAD